MGIPSGREWLARSYSLRRSATMFSLGFDRSSMPIQINPAASKAGGYPSSNDVHDSIKGLSVLSEYSYH